MRRGQSANRQRDQTLEDRDGRARERGTSLLAGVKLPVGALLLAALRLAEDRPDDPERENDRGGRVRGNARVVVVPGIVRARTPRQRPGPHRRDRARPPRARHAPAGAHSAVVLLANLAAAFDREPAAGRRPKGRPHLLRASMRTSTPPPRGRRRGHRRGRRRAVKAGGAAEAAGDDPAIRSTPSSN